MDNFLFVFSTLFPIYVTLLLGMGLRRFGVLSPEGAKGINTLMFWVALPCMIISSVANAQFSDGIFRTTGALVAVTLLVLVVSWFAAPLFGVSRASRPSFCQSVFRNNNAYIGIPVILFAFNGRSDASQAAALTLLTLSPCLILYNILAVFLLTPRDAKASLLSRSVKLAAGMLKNPLIIASIIGTVLMLLRQWRGIAPPPVINKTVDWIAQMASPGSLIGLGASITIGKMRSCLKQAHAACALKLAFMPIAGMLCAGLFGLSPLERFICVAFLACPCAVASFVMAQAMNGDAELAGASVALSTFYSILSLSAVLAFAMPALPL